jgi:5-methylcytosine-specific restriction protein B
MPTDLAEAIEAFDRTAASNRRAEAEELRRAFLKEFPESDWPTLPLERYALGLGDGRETYSRWAEFKTRDLGSMSGGSAHKHVIYKHKDKPGWHYPAQFASEKAAWESLRADVVKMLALAREQRWDEMADLMPFQFGPALWLKTLHLYFPDDVLAVYSTDHLAHFWYQLTGESSKASKKQPAILLNRNVLSRLREEPGLAGLSPLELSYFLYEWNDPREARAVYKIAPGEGAKYWDECLAGGYVCVGWSRIGDLTEFDDFTEFEALFREQHLAVHGDSSAEKATATRKARELWLLTKIRPGDLIFANQGTSRILGVGEVLDPAYEWAGPEAAFPHRIRVKWDTSLARSIPPQKRWPFLTIAPVKLEDYERMFSGEPVAIVARASSAPAVATDPELEELADRLHERKQLVIYGPPGTGKTYTARRFVLHWLLSGEGKPAAEVLADPDRFRQEWSRLTRAEDGRVAQVTMLTFHPSYGYEDFVEGFRPVPSQEAGLKLELQDGVFKRSCRAAQSDPEKRFVVFIDEINRGNLPRILGELITVIEADKRGMSIVLPQSRQPFTVPPNLYIVGTMNTADRSIKVLDAAIRRRFAFHELMPDSSLLTGQQFGDLLLDRLLDHLNATAVRKVGREKQIGHSVFLVDEEPVSDLGEFAKRMRFEVIPLLQEYCYEDYGTLAEFLGTELVDVEAQALKTEVLTQPDALAAALARAIASAGSA